jgi:hypothetical protein
MKKRKLRIGVMLLVYCVGFRLRVLDIINTFQIFNVFIVFEELYLMISIIVLDLCEFLLNWIYSDIPVHQSCHPIVV